MCVCVCVCVCVCILQCTLIRRAAYTSLCVHMHFIVCICVSDIHPRLLPWHNEYVRVCVCVCEQVKHVKHSGNISMNDVIEIARVMAEKSNARDLSGTIREILGTCVSVGCTVDDRSPKDLAIEIRDGELEVPLK